METVSMIGNWVVEGTESMKQIQAHSITQKIFVLQILFTVKMLYSEILIYTLEGSKIIVLYFGRCVSMAGYFLRTYGSISCEFGNLKIIRSEFDGGSMEFLECGGKLKELWMVSLPTNWIAMV